MKTKLKLLTWNIEDDCIFSREFKYENEAIEVAQALSNREVCRHDIIEILRVRESGHRWDLAVWNIEKPSNLEHVSFYSKEDAAYAIIGIKEYNKNLETSITKIY